jgi:ATP-binding cassette, subfamily C (CFTR/MRP), member 1
VGKYVVAGGAALWIISLIFLYAGDQGVKILSDTWVGFWTQEKFGDRGLTFYLSCYAALAVVLSIITYIRSVTFTFGAVWFLCPLMRSDRALPH